MTQTLTPNRQRISSIDVLRGIIMIIMALDHTRDFFHKDAILGSPTNLATTTPVLFFTRWITHFCAPVFLFLSGIAAYMNGQRKTKKELSIYLIKRGAWLVVAEVVIMTFILSFNPAYNIIFLAVIWAIGWSMIFLGLLVHGSYKLIATVGILIFFFHNILDFVNLPQQGPASISWLVLFTSPGTFLPLGAGRGILLGYAILPWTGVMLLGYAAGYLYKKDFDAIKRKRTLATAGISLIGLFIFLRLINMYGDPSPWSTQKNAMLTFLSFLNVTKYPVSLQFCCMTLGPALLLLAFLETKSNSFTRFANVYGRVPFFYFVLHFLLIHIFCMIAFFVTGHTMAEAVDPRSPFLFRPAEFGFSPGATYIVWISVVLLMYYPNKWFGKYKQTHRQWWLSYI